LVVLYEIRTAFIDRFLLVWSSKNTKAS